MENNYTAPTIAVVILAVFYANEALKTNAYNKQRESVLSDNVKDEYDYVIVGGGTSGCVLASRLSENENNRVLLLEAGGFYDENPNFPFLSYAESLKQSEHDWAYFTAPQKNAMFGMVDNRAYLPRGRVLGGSSMLSDGLYVRGSRYDYDSLGKELDEEWNYKNVLPYFLKSENIQSETLARSKYHHLHGQMAVTESGSTPLADLFLKAGKELGYNITDYNGASQNGFSRPQLNIRKGIRETSAVGILARVRERKNLNTRINAYVTSIEIKDKRAIGVNYLYDGNKHFVGAKKDVILSAGAVKSPQLLLLAGIGPKDHLNEMNIPVIVDLPIGQNLQDHLAVPLMSKINKSLGYTKEDFEGSWSKFQHKTFGTGPLSRSSREAIAFLSTKGKLEQAPDIQMTFSSMLLPMKNLNLKSDILNEIAEKFNDSDGFTVQLAITKPKSKGVIQLQSTDSFDQPLVDPQYLVNKSDIETYVAGIRLWEKFISSPTMQSIGADINQMKFKFCEQHKFQSDAFWECIVRYLATTSHDLAGTCKMGARSDKSSVLNSKLQVHGIEGLRVVDASVFPRILNGNMNAPSVMLAEKASDIIQEIDTVQELRQKLPFDV